jgi:hypothetical protein
MSAKKVWNSGDQLTASDLNGNFRFGGTGADGALTVSSGTTTVTGISAGYLEKNYTTVSITGTGVLGFTTLDATRGTTIVLRATGNVAITSSATRVIDLRSAGGGSDGQTGSNISSGTTAIGPGGGGGGSTGGNGTQGSHTTGNNVGAGTGGPGGNGHGPLIPFIRPPRPGGNGGSGGSGVGTSGGAGGLGGGALYIECGGAYNFTGTIDCSGAAGSTGGTGGTTNGGGGGGGAGGNVLVIYGTLTADSGTYTVSGGSGASAGGGAGANGTAYRAINTYFS